MTECERLIQNGFISDNFLSEEVRLDYTVSVKMKKVWAIELDLLSQLDKVCREHHLRYWVAYGTLLGAVRHQGFIPWDDDVDIWMPRKDYELLLKLGNTVFSEPYFLQTTETDKEYYCAFARLRNSNTTGIFVSKNNNCNNGIYIDIFPMDHISNRHMLQFAKSVKIRLLNYLAQTNTYESSSAPKKILRPVLKMVGLSSEKVYEKVDKLAQSCKEKSENVIGVVVYSYFPFVQDHFYAEDFLKTDFLAFENLIVPVPKGYKRVLKCRYGDYMKLPPLEKRGTWHSFMFEPDTPYKVFFRIETADEDIVSCTGE